MRSLISGLDHLVYVSILTDSIRGWILSRTDQIYQSIFPRKIEWYIRTLIRRWEKSKRYMTKKDPRVNFSNILLWRLICQNKFDTWRRFTTLSSGEERVASEIWDLCIDLAVSEKEGKPTISNTGPNFTSGDSAITSRITNRYYGSDHLNDLLLSFATFVTFCECCVYQWSWIAPWRW